MAISGGTYINVAHGPSSYASPVNGYDNNVDAQSITLRDGHLWVTQCTNVTTGDLVVCRESTNGGDKQGHMTLLGFGHGIAVGVEITGGVDYIWVETAPEQREGKAYGTRLARIPWSANAELHPSDVQKFDVPNVSGASNVTCYIADGNIYIRYIVGQAHYVAYDLTDFKAGGPLTALSPARVEPSSIGENAAKGPNQGWTASGKWVYILSGVGKATAGVSHAYITTIDLTEATGWKDQEEKNIANGPTDGLDPREPEGITMDAGNSQLLFGLTNYTANGKNLHVYAIA